ncbi:MAG: periplasmic heavy metal sensor [Pseudomonadota bacterium]
MTDPVAPKSTRVRRWGLFASLALNVALVGVIGGAVYRDQAAPPQAQILRGDVLRPLFQSLSPEDQASVRRQLAQETTSFRVVRRDFRQANRQVLNALTASPFQEAQLASALDAHRGFLLKFGQASQTVILTQLRTLTDAERAQVAEAVRAHLNRRPKPQDRRPKGQGGARQD